MGTRTAPMFKKNKAGARDQQWRTYHGSADSQMPCLGHGQINCERFISTLLDCHSLAKREAADSKGTRPLFPVPAERQWIASVVFRLGYLPPFDSESVERSGTGSSLVVAGPLSAELAFE
jgi:hypothetical protein